MERQIADISKTVRFTQREWDRWQRLIGPDGRENWADVVNAALRGYEKDLVARGLLPSATDIRGAAPHPGLGDAPPPAAVAGGMHGGDFSVNGRMPCKTCGRDQLVNGAGICHTCELKRVSGGKITSADKVKPPAKVRNGSQPAEASPAGRSRGRAAASKRGE